MTTDLSFVRFWVPPESSLHDAALYESTVSFMTALSGLLASHPRATASLELLAQNKDISYVLAIPQAWQTALIHHLYAAFPAGWAEPLDEWADPDLSGELAGAQVVFGPQDAWLYAQKYHTDPLQPLLELLASVPADERLMMQLTLASNRRPSLLAQMLSDLNAGLRAEARALILGRSSVDIPSGAQSDRPYQALTWQAATLQANLRLISLAPTRTASASLVRQALGTLHQFARPDDIKPGETRVAPSAPVHLKSHTPARLHSWVRSALQRRFDPAAAFLLTPAEAAMFYHPPARPSELPLLRQIGTRQLPPPSLQSSSSSDHPLVLGQAVYRGHTRPVHLAAPDRLRHAYIIGQTGSGKSTLLQSAILQDIEAGEGCAFIDPHGEVIDWLLPRIPSHRLNDVVLFDPSDPQGLLGLNLLEWRTQAERDLLIQELISLFYKLFDPEHTGIIGPQFEHWLRSAALTVTEPTVRGTLVDIPRLFTDPAFAKAMVTHAQHQAVKDFWHGQIAQTAAFHKSEMLNYFTSKFGSFLGNDVMRRILSQRTSAFDLRAIMDRRKILLVNLSKGKLGSHNSTLLGTLIMAKIQLAALSRADLPPGQRLPFYVYIDEFQNLATDSFTSLLSEIRKYGVGLTLAHQYADQLSDSLRKAVVGNVGTMIAFRLGHTDADWLSSHFTPLTAADLTNLEPYHYHIRTLSNGQLTTPFTARSLHIQTQPQVVVASAIRDRVHQYVMTVQSQV